MKEKILLVDDREDNILSLEAILEPDGYELVKAQSGHQALKILLKEFDFALILMDVKMPIAVVKSVRLTCIPASY